MTKDIDTARLSSELRRHRRSRDLSLDDLVVPGVSKSTLSRIERCEGVPDADVLAHVALALDKPLGTFLTANRGKIVHYSDAPTIERIAAVLHADASISEAARNAILDLLTVAVTEAAHV
ncbi:MAG TPA: helix-turn-helix transcriptional regulator [Pyrinomonadaceae bacterium]|jgi:transcriptional regulator with XRE-family HTH domain|nr:helix-turn-helix transcriptional regulator [Pyrinomonadaceae bacterium]